MRYFLPIILFFAISCSEHKDQIAHKNLQTDTAKLPGPKPPEDKTVENRTIFANCIMLENDRIAVNTCGQKAELQNTKELQKFLQDNAAGIGKRRFYIVYSDNTSNKTIADITYIVKGAKIDNYKAISFQSLFTLNEPKQ